MGKRGPKPTPSATLKLRGSWRGNRNPDEPAPDPGTPPCPDWLEGEAREEWDRLVPRLLEMGVLTVVDGNALARYCQLWARWREAEEFLRQHGSVYPLKNADGSVKYIQQYPQVAIAHKLAGQLSRLEQEFGLTPSSRTGIRAIASKGTDHGSERFFAS